MKILLDECVPWPLFKLFPQHQCTPVQKCGWAGLKNGELLARVDTDFDVFLTSDQGILYQQNLKGRRIAIVQLPTNKLRLLRAIAAEIVSEVEAIESGEFRIIELTPHDSG